MQDASIIHELSAEHKDYLATTHAIRIEIAQRYAHTSPTGQGVVFHWSDGETEVWQGRTDDGQRKEGWPKYLWPKGQALILWRVVEPEGNAPIVLVEGTCQVLSVASHLAPGAGVYGIGGCDGWAKLDLAWAYDRTVFVLFDGDIRVNRNVYDAAVGVRDRLLSEGAAAVRFVLVPARGTDGIDDLLARKKTDGERTAYLDRLIALSVERLPAKPARRQHAGSSFFDENGSLDVKLLADAIREEHPVALTVDKRIAVYRNGVYAPDDMAFNAAVVERLEGAHRRTYRDDVESYLLGKLYLEGTVLPDRLTEPLLNLRNGMLDLRTGKLWPHDPKYLSSLMLKHLEWNEDAPCPVYDEWIQQQIPDQLDDLEECTSTMLDLSRTPSKAIFNYGPPRTGKGTYLRLMQGMVGSQLFSAVTLLDLEKDRFAGAHVFGKLLNVAGDISASHVEDVSLFKMMTGEDPIKANPKYGRQFTFFNRALFAFSANEVPTVGENSGAYATRMRPFQWKVSFEGKEDPRIEQAMLKELPGILVRWVRAWRRWHANGGYGVGDVAVNEDFREGSDWVQLFVGRRCTVFPLPGGAAFLPDVQTSTIRQFVHPFNFYLERNGGSRMGERAIKARLMRVPGVRIVKRHSDRNLALNLTVNGTDEPDNGERGGEKLTTEKSPLSGSGESGGEVSISAHRLPHVESPFPDLKHLDARELLANTETGNDVNMREPVGSYGKKATISTNTRLAGGSVVTFDLETADKAALWTHGSDFIRLCGYAVDDGPVILTTDVSELLTVLAGASIIVGHNVFGFDLLALARWHGLDLASLRGRVVDTLLLAVQDDPPVSRTNGTDFARKYSLDDLGQRLFGQGKDGDLKALAKEFKGHDAIPTDDERYRAYLTRDVALTRELYRHFELSAYATREMEVARRAAVMSLAGFRVDVPLLEERIAEGQARKEAALKELATLEGMPTARKDGKVSSNPLATEQGTLAVLHGFKAKGVVHWPWKTKGGTYTIGQEAMAGVKALYPDNYEVELLANLVLAVNGTRTTYQTVKDYLVGDRVHPSVNIRQATGRWSITEPGLTVMGKRNGRARERDVFLPDEGEVLLSVDFSQVDARSVAALSGDRAYQALFEEGDLWSNLADQVGTDREIAKVLGHAWNYNAGIAKLVTATGIPEEIIREFDASMRAQFPGVVAWKEAVVEEAQAGQLFDNGWGRRMRPDPERAYTTGPATMGQGCARDIMMRGLLELPEELAVRVRAIIHDEIVLTVPRSAAQGMSERVVEALSCTFRGVPITAGVGPVGVSWGACYPQDTH